MASSKIDLSQISIQPGLDYEYETRLKVDRISFEVIRWRVTKSFPNAEYSKISQTDYYVEEDDYRYTTFDNLSYDRVLKTEKRVAYDRDIKYSLSTEKVESTTYFVVSEDKKHLIGTDGEEKLTIKN